MKTLSANLNSVNNVRFNKTAAGLNPSGRVSFKGSISSASNGLAKSKIFGKVLDITANNSLIAEALFALGLTAVLRPITILALPTKNENDKKKNKYQVGHSIATGIMGLATTIAIAEPVKRGVSKLMANSGNLVNEKTANFIKSNKDVFKETANRLHQPIFLPLRAAATIAIVPIILKKIFGIEKPSGKDKAPTDIANSVDYTLMPSMSLRNNVANRPVFQKFAGLNESSPTPEPSAQLQPSFKGLGSAVTDTIATGVGKVAGTSGFQGLVEGLGKSANWFPHLVAAESLLLSGFYMSNTAKSKKIENDQKLPMILNQGIVALACTVGAYSLDGFVNKGINNFKETYKSVNKALPEELLNKRLKGISLLKTMVVFTTIYRFIGPVLLTPVANKISSIIQDKTKNKDKTKAS